MSSAERKQATSPAVLGSKRRAVGLSRRLNRRNSFKSPVLNAESSNSIRHNKVNVTELSSPNTSLPNVKPTAKEIIHSVATCPTNVRPKVRPNSNNNVTVSKQGFSQFNTKDSLNSITPVSSGLELNLRLQESHEDSAKLSQHSHTNKKLDHGEASESAAKTYTVNARLPQISTPSSSRKRPQTQRNIFGKKFKTDFKSPVRNVPGEESKLQIEESISDLKKRLQAADNQIKNLQESGYELEEVQRFMAKLHEYNELKDIGQFLIGQIAFKEGTTTKQVYGRFGLNLED